MNTLPEIPEEAKSKFNTKKEKSAMNVVAAQEVQTDRVDESDMKLRERITVNLQNPYQEGEPLTSNTVE